MTDNRGFYITMSVIGIFCISILLGIHHLVTKVADASDRKDAKELQVTREYKKASKDKDFSEKTELANRYNKEYSDFNKELIKETGIAKENSVDDLNYFSEGVTDNYNEDVLKYLRDTKVEDYDLPTLKKAEKLLKNNRDKNTLQTVTLKEIDATHYYLNTLRDLKAEDTSKLSEQEKQQRVLKIASIINKLQDFSNRKYTELDKTLKEYQQLLS